MMEGRSVFLFGILYLCRVHFGSCFISTSSNSVRATRIAKPLTSSIDTNGVDAVDYNDDFDDSSWSKPNNDWMKDPASNLEFEAESNEQVGERTVQSSEEDVWIQNAIDEIHNVFSILDDHLLDESSSDDSIEASIDSEMDDEIAMLVRCNESPESLLIEEGRAYAPLTIDEKNDVSQLVVFKNDKFEVTEFFNNAVSKMFREHSAPSPFDGIICMDRASIASWMTKALKSEGEGKVSPHDHRVLKTLSDFGVYGSGRLVEEEFHVLYRRCLLGNESNLSSVSVKRHMQLRTPFRDAVWRDIRAHGIISPIEEERSHLIEELNERNSKLTVHGDNGSKKIDQMIVDECEILDWDYRAPELKKRRSKSSTRNSSSHKLVEMSNDKKTPLRMKDGEFVLIDEESCIGCRKCVDMAPSSFSMMDSGRARTYSQRKTVDVDFAVDSCPASCMHHVSYDELSAFETARDKADLTIDPKTFKQGFTPIPLHVAGMDSDHNRRSSWYHTLKFKCFMSPGCPKKGCFDCPFYSKPGGNPYFIAKQKRAEHTRAQHFIETGEADPFRKALDL